MNSPLVVPAIARNATYVFFVRAAIDAYKRRSELDAIIEQTSGLEPDEMRFVLAEGVKQ